MGTGERVIYAIPPGLMARPQWRFRWTMVAGVAAGAAVLVFIGLTSLGADPSEVATTYLILIPAWAIPLLLALLSHRMLRFNNGLAITDRGYYPAFRLRGTPRGQRSFVPLEDMEKVAVVGRGDGFTATVALWTGPAIVLTSTDLERYFRQPIRAEFPGMVGGFEELRAAVESRSRRARG